MKYLFTLIIFSFLTGCSNNRAEPLPSNGSLTKENYLKVELGMSNKEVIAILGNSYEIVKSIQLKGFSRVEYKWLKGAKCSCNIIFTNKKVKAKLQSGLFLPETSTEAPANK